MLRFFQQWGESDATGQGLMPAVGVLPIALDVIHPAGQADRTLRGCAQGKSLPSCVISLLGHQVGKPVDIFHHLPDKLGEVLDLGVFKTLGQGHAGAFSRRRSNSSWTWHWLAMLHTSELARASILTAFHSFSERKAASIKMALAAEAAWMGLE